MHNFRGLITSLILLALGTSVSSAQESQPTFRVMTYNIHHGEGVDGKLDLERIATLIQQERADLVALQEVDRGVTRTAKRDLAKELAELTDMHHVFGKN